MQGWQDGGMKTENGNAVLEFWSHGVTDRLRGAGPEAGVPTKTREASPCGKRRLGRWGFTACYRIATRFYRLGPDKSTQVVDFPHIGVVRLFWEAMNWLVTDGTRTKRGCRKDGLIRKPGTEENRKGKQEGLTTDGHQWRRIWKNQERNEPARTGCMSCHIRIWAAGMRTNCAAKCA